MTRDQLIQALGLNKGKADDYTMAELEREYQEMVASVFDTDRNFEVELEMDDGA